jgi:hypothetical protein
VIADFSETDFMQTYSNSDWLKLQRLYCIKLYCRFDCDSFSYFKRGTINILPFRMSKCACLTSVQAMLVIAQAASSCKTGISCRASNSTKRGTIPASTTRSTGGNLSVQ